MDFDINDLRGVMSALILLAFILLFVWVSIGSRDRFRAAAELPFLDPADEAGIAPQSRHDEEPRA